MSTRWCRHAPAHPARTPACYTPLAPAGCAGDVYTRTPELDTRGTGTGTGTAQRAAAPEGGQSSAPATPAPSHQGPLHDAGNPQPSKSLYIYTASHRRKATSHQPPATSQVEPPASQPATSQPPDTPGKKLEMNGRAGGQAPRPPPRRGPWQGPCLQAGSTTSSPPANFGQIQFWSHPRQQQRPRRLTGKQTTNVARCAPRSSQQ